MSPLQPLREFIRQRLTAAAEEIFSEVEKSIVRLEEELDAQRRMTGINWRAEIKISRTGAELQSSDVQNSIKQEAFPSVHLLWNQEAPWREEEPMEPEPPLTGPEGGPGPARVKEEEEEAELPPTDEGKEEPDSVWLQQAEPPPTGPTGSTGPTELEQKEEEHLMEEFPPQEADLSLEPGSEQLPSHISPLVGSKDQEGSSSTGPRGRARSDIKNTPFQCEICEKFLTSKFSLERHLKIHRGEKPFTCTTCGRSFSLLAILTSHMRVHTREKPFSCQTCGKSFSQSSALKVHMTLHTGEKPFPCETCPKRFARVGNLQVHRRIHSGEKPFSCKTCGKSFRLSSCWNNHMRIHTGEKPFSCQICGKMFNAKSNLYSHKKHKH